MLSYKLSDCQLFKEYPEVSAGKSGYHLFCWYELSKIIERGMAIEG
jgi:hypothetical protein